MTPAIDPHNRRQRQNGEFLVGAVLGGAIILFVGTGSMVLAPMLRQLRGTGGGLVDQTLLVAMILNIAIILFGWMRYRSMADEVVALTQAGEHAERLAARDLLTGFLNRRSLAEEGEAMRLRGTRRSSAMALLVLDVDHFKTVNDLHGHATGDVLLRQIAAEMSTLLPQVSLAARLGGDEFACAFLFDPAHPDVVDRIADTIVTRLANPFRTDGIQLHISVSMGIARSDTDCPSFETLLRAADIAMYAAKEQGRNRYAWFDRSMEQALQVRNALETGLRTAIPNGEIVPYFEQQVDLTSGRLSGFEVLARWEHPTRGLIMPEAFIRIAEETGMIADLSLSVMRQAFAAARDWDPALTLSLNISPWQLKDPWLAQKIIKLLTETGFPARRLEVEITESALFDNLPLAQSIVGSLKNQGIRLALDDFGTGYSSLAHLRALPFDRIKIDRSFVASILDNAESAAIVNAIARLGDSLNLPTTAEGIEDAHVEERLRALGCAKGQGYLYGRPLNLAGVRRLLSERRLLTGQASAAPDRPTLLGPQRMVG